MKENMVNFDKNSKFFMRFSKYTAFILIIIGIAFLIRFYFFPLQVPLNDDALYYFWYSSDIFHIGKLPSEWSPSNIGWPIFVSMFFIIFDLNDVSTLMLIQQLLSVIISVLISIPTYFLCKRFVARKFAIIGAILIAFEPRLMINSFLGVTDSFYLLLITTSLTLFLFPNKKMTYVSVVVIALATIVRGEGIIVFSVISIMYFIRYRKENYKIFFKYLILLGIFTLIILPVSFYQIEVNDNDGIFMRSFTSVGNTLSNITDNDSTNNIIDGLTIFVKYLIWVMIPNFIIFIPFGLFLIFQKRNFEKNTMILSLGIMSVPALYAYTVPAMDTRYLYVLFPIFSVLAVLVVEKISEKINRTNIIMIIIISVIILSSIIFYDYKKIDYKHERESFEIMEKVSKIVRVTNVLYQETSYLNTIQTIEQWPNLYTEMGLGTNLNVITISTDNFNSLEDYIIESKDDGLTHIIIDNKEERQSFLRDVFFEENNYPYLEKIYDSRMDGFTYQVKVFKINYELYSEFISDGKR